MAGTSESGWAAGSAGLFADAAWVVASDDGADLAGVGRRRRARLGLRRARRARPRADEHDLAVARISHLPHLLAAVLAAVGARG